MRLAGCVLIELAIGASICTGVAAGAWFGSEKVRQLRAEAAAPATEAAQAPASALRPLAANEPPRRLPAASYFLGVRDDVLLAPLRLGAVTRVKFNRGGSSISLRVDFEGGGRAAFKPEQAGEHSLPRREVAAYRINRLLGLDSVPPSIVREVTYKELVAKVEPGSLDILPRMREEVMVNADGSVYGEASWWIPLIIDASIEGDRIDEPQGINTWHRYLTAGEPEPNSLTARNLLPQISNLLVFDYLINNTDRFSGSNAKSSPDGRILYFMDNTLSFGPFLEGAPRVRQLLEYNQKLSRNLVARIRELDEPLLRAALARDLGPVNALLSDAEIAGVIYRRDRFLAYVDELIAEHGEAAVMVYP